MEHSDTEAPNPKPQISKNTNYQNPKKVYWVIRIWRLELIWDLEFVI